MALYHQIYMYFNGALAVENTTIETSLEADDQDAETIPKGWAGITPAPRKRKVSGDSLIPNTGFEFRFEKAFLEAEEVEIKLQHGGSGKTCVSKGYFRSVKVGAGVGKSATVSFEFTGTASEFK